MCDDHILLDELERSLSDLREVEARMVVFFHYIAELQLTEVKEADVILVSLVLVKHDLDLGLAERIRVTVDDVDDLADDDAFRVGVVNILQVGALLVGLLQVEDLELATQTSGLDVDLSRSRLLSMRRRLLAVHHLFSLGRTSWYFLLRH